eukprot:1067681-Pleurochrysis_carterae.AAC.1
MNDRLPRRPRPAIERPGSIHAPVNDGLKLSCDGHCAHRRAASAGRRLRLLGALQDEGGGEGPVTNGTGRSWCVYDLLSIMAGRLDHVHPRVERGDRVRGAIRTRLFDLHASARCVDADL